MSLGTELREQRQSRDISLVQIQAATKISIRFLEAIEADQFERLPGGVFNRGFLRSYCEAVGVDAEPIVQRYESAFSDQEALIGPTEPNLEPIRTPRPRRGWQVGSSLVALALLGWWLWPRPQPPAPPQPAPPPSEPQLQPAPPASPAKLQITLSLQAESWAEIHVDGERRIFRTLQPAETLALEADQQFTVTLGNPAAVALQLQGRPASWRRSLTRPIHDLTITPDNAADFLLTPEELEAAAAQPSHGNL